MISKGDALSRFDNRAMGFDKLMKFAAGAGLGQMAADLPKKPEVYLGQDAVCSGLPALIEMAHTTLTELRDPDTTAAKELVTIVADTK